MKKLNPLDVLKAKNNIFVKNPYAVLWGRKLSGGYEPAEATGTLPLTFRSNGTALIDYRIYGNTVETTLKTANLVPLTTQKTATGSGITVTIDDSGVWHVTGTASQDVNILFDLEEAFTVPTALDNGGEGVIQFFNSVAMDDGSGYETARVLFYYGNFQRDYMGLHIQNRSITQYSDLANMAINRLGIWVKQGITCDFTLSPMVVDDGIVHNEYIPPETTEVQGVGVRTENLFDPNAAETSGNNIISDFMPLDSSELVLTMAFDIPLRASYNYNVTYYDSTKTAISFVGGMGEAYKTRETVKFNRQSEAPNATYVKFTLPKDLTNVLIQNGSTSGEYIPYGYKMPMVSRTENLFDKDTYLVGGTQNPSLSTNYRNEIRLKPNTTYTMSSNVPYVSTANHLYVYSSFDSGAEFNICYAVHPITFTTHDDGILYFEYARRSYYTKLLDGTYYVMLTEGSTAPDQYIPYHRTDTPIYIGDTQLMQDEYVSYSEQAIYKRTKNLWNGEWSSKTFEIQPNTAYAIGKYPPLGAQKGRIALAVYNDSMNKLWSDYAFAWRSTSCPANLSTAKYAIVTVAPPSDNYFFGEATYFDATRYIPYLEPTSPPVPLPQLPTFSDADTVLDYEETPAPEEVWVKYKKGD